MKVLFIAIFTILSPFALAVDKKKVDCKALEEKLCPDEEGRHDCIEKNMKEKKLPYACIKDRSEKIVSGEIKDPCLTQMQELCNGANAECLMNVKEQLPENCQKKLGNGPTGSLEAPEIKKVVDGCSESIQKICFQKNRFAFNNPDEASKAINKCITEGMAKKSFGKKCHDTIMNTAKEVNKKRENPDLYKTIED